MDKIDVISSIDMLEDNINVIVPHLISGDRVALANNIESLSAALMSCLPKVIAIYDEPFMAENKDDVEYWPQQLNRIMGALEAGDLFLAYDGLVNELLANLNLLKNSIM